MLVALAAHGLAARPPLTSLRRAAGANDESALAELLERTGASAADVDHDVDESGRSALHHACWRGALGNVRRLLDLGCDVNRWSTGMHSYGKTPIFYAITRDRDPVVELLLERGAKTRILNNKGQSVLSLAASHLSPVTVAVVEAAEAAEGDGTDAWSARLARLPEAERPVLREGGWLDFIASHPDGERYGDLDPRFLSSAAHDELVAAGCARTRLSVCPTTREGRRLKKHLPGTIDGADGACRDWKRLATEGRGGGRQAGRGAAAMARAHASASPAADASASAIPSAAQLAHALDSALEPLVGLFARSGGGADAAAAADGAAAADANAASAATASSNSNANANAKAAANSGAAGNAAPAATATAAEAAEAAAEATAAASVEAEAGASTAAAAALGDSGGPPAPTSAELAGAVDALVLRLRSRKGPWLQQAALRVGRAAGIGRPAGSGTAAALLRAAAAHCGGAEGGGAEGGGAVVVGGSGGAVAVAEGGAAAAAAALAEGDAALLEAPSSEMATAYPCSRDPAIVSLRRRLLLQAANAPTEAEAARAATQASQAAALAAAQNAAWAEAVVAAEARRKARVASLVVEAAVPPPVRFVDDVGGLRAVREALARATLVGVDTEW